MSLGQYLQDVAESEGCTLLDADDTTETCVIQVTLNESVILSKELATDSVEAVELKAAEKSPPTQNDPTTDQVCKEDLLAGLENDEDWAEITPPSSPTGTIWKNMLLGIDSKEFLEEMPMPTTSLSSVSLQQEGVTFEQNLEEAVRRLKNLSLNDTLPEDEYVQAKRVEVLQPQLEDDACNSSQAQRVEVQGTQSPRSPCSPSVDDLQPQVQEEQNDSRLRLPVLLVHDNTTETDVGDVLLHPAPMKTVQSAAVGTQQVEEEYVDTGYSQTKVAYMNKLCLYAVCTETSPPVITEEDIDCANSPTIGPQHLISDKEYRCASASHVEQSQQCEGPSKKTEPSTGAKTSEFMLSVDDVYGTSGEEEEDYTPPICNLEESSPSPYTTITSSSDNEEDSSSEMDEA